MDYTIKVASWGKEGEPKFLWMRENSLTLLMRFYVDTPEGKEIRLDVPFIHGFILGCKSVMDWKDCGDDWEKCFESNLMYFIWWGWKKEVEKEIEVWEKDGIPTLREIRLAPLQHNEDHLKWAEKIAEKIDLEICKKLASEEGYQYSPPPRKE